MNTHQENIIVDSCQYTPVYLVQNTGAIQGRPYIVAQANVDETKPVSDNLKNFYESSGILENNFVNNGPTISKPRILKKQDSKHIGNKFKLASFLLNKSSQENNLNKQCLPVNNVILKQVFTGNGLKSVPKVEVVSANVVNTAAKMEIVTANIVNSAPKVELLTTNVINNAPKVEILSTNNISKVELVSTNVVNNASKVECSNLTMRNKGNEQCSINVPQYNCTSVPKVEVDRKIVKLKNFPSAFRMTPRDIKPKMKPREDSPNTNATKHTSVQLLKLGETYHSLNQLSDEQMKMVNQALKIFSNPEKTSMEPTYDPVTNTKFIYKVVSPRDLTVVGKNKIKKEESQTITIKKEYKREPIIEEEEIEPEPPIEVKITRSGRKVKFPKQIDLANTSMQQKPKKKQNGPVVSCFQCSTEFCSLYRLQKHYENHPTHIPTKVHSNLFHCLLAIIKSGSEEDRTNIFIQQLEQLIEKLRSLLPCLLKKIDGSVGKSCTINDDIGRLFGMNPGKYNLNADALTCVKDKDGNCRHNPPPPKNQFKSDLNKPSQIWLSKHNEDITNMDSETEDCARINAVDKWPTANKRIRNSKQQKSLKSAKKMRVASDSSEAIIDLEDLVNFSTPNEQSAIHAQPKSLCLLDNIDLVSDNSIQELVNNEQSTSNELSKTMRGAPTQFNLSISDSQSAINLQSKSLNILDNTDIRVGSSMQPVLRENHKPIIDPPRKPKGAHTQFHSTHFDIRSSPIKSSSAATFCKFQINPEKLGKYEVQILRPLDLDKSSQETEKEPIKQASAIETPAEPEHDPEDLHSIFRDDIIALTCKDTNDIPNDLAFEATKDWICSGLNGIIEKPDDNFMKTSCLEESFIRTNSLIEPALLHLKEDSADKLPIINNLTTNVDHLTESDNRLLSNQGSSVLNFLDSLGSECLSYPETEIRHNAVDFQLDLFSFSNT